MAKKSKSKKSTVKKTTAVKKAPAGKKLAKIKKPYTKSEILSVLSERTQLTKKQVSNVFEELNAIASAHIKKGSAEKFIMPGLFKIVVKHVPAKPAREGRNPFTGETMMFKAKPASKKVKIMPMKQLKEIAAK